MKKHLVLYALLTAILTLTCAGSSGSLKLGECPLTVTVKAEDADFDGFANVFIDSKFIGTTDSQRGQLRVNLRKGEYTVIVIAEGYQPWKGKILLLGNGYKQNALARLKKKEPAEGNGNTLP